MVETEQTSTVPEGQTSTVPEGQTSTVPEGQTSTGPEDQKSHPFEIMLYVPQFFPHEILVKICNKTIWVIGKHGEHVDEHGFVSRKFTKRYDVPDNVVPGKLRADFTGDGVLIVREMEEAMTDYEVKMKEKRSIQQKFVQEYESACENTESS